MFKRQKTGSVVCSSCGSLVGVNDDRCYSCGRRNPGLWGFGPMLRRFGNDLGFVTLVVYGCSVLYALTLIGTVALGDSVVSPGNMMNFSPRRPLSRWHSARAARSPVFRLRHVVDGAERRMAARQRPPHPLQHAVGPPARPRDGRHLRRRPHGHHLHRRRARRASSSAASRAAVCRASRSRSSAAPPSHWARPRRSSGCSARWCTTAGAAGAA